MIFFSNEADEYCNTIIKNNDNLKYCKKNSRFLFVFQFTLEAEKSL